MEDEKCDKCGKSLFIIHPYDWANCSCPDESDTPLFIFEDDASTKYSDAQMKDIPVGDKFVLGGHVYTKTSTMGWFVGFCNVINENGERGHIHPSERVSLLQ